jgi:methyl-accepting chemotaxis protein
LTETQFTDISQIAKDYNSVIKEVEGASRESSQGLARVNEAIVRVDQITQRSAAMAEENAAATVELKAQTENVFMGAAQLHQMIRNQPAGGEVARQSPPSPPAAPRPKPAAKTPGLVPAN